MKHNLCIPSQIFSVAFSWPRQCEVDFSIEILAGASLRFINAFPYNMLKVKLCCYICMQDFDNPSFSEMGGSGILCTNSNAIAPKALSACINGGRDWHKETMSMILRCAPLLSHLNIHNRKAHFNPIWSIHYNGSLLAPNSSRVRRENDSGNYLGTIINASAKEKVCLPLQIKINNRTGNSEK